MKRMLAQAGIALVGLTTWLLPNQANAHIICRWGGLTWTCPDGTQCTVVLVDHGDHYHLIGYGCT